MGLTISASIIERHCGKLSARRQNRTARYLRLRCRRPRRKRKRYSAGWLLVRRSTALTSSATERTCIFSITRRRCTFTVIR